MDMERENKREIESVMENGKKIEKMKSDWMRERESKIKKWMIRMKTESKRRIDLLNENEKKYEN